MRAQAVQFLIRAFRSGGLVNQLMTAAGQPNSLGWGVSAVSGCRVQLLCCVLRRGGVTEGCVVFNLEILFLFPFLSIPSTTPHSHTKQNKHHN